ncbi:MAG: DoxX family protein [Chitinophagaceae bacterium]|nr:DoxX family protein [Chitinophagaceae bacterium]MBS4043203.1 DoxX family protein [Chitinophagaceae bacterium]
MKNKILLVVYVLFALMFINSGLNKFFQYMPMPTDMPENAQKLFGAFMEIKWLMPLIAIVEIVGGLLFISNKFRPLAAIMIFPIMVGILLTHIINIPSGLIMAIILFAINAWAIYDNRAKYMHMIQ